MLSEKELKLAGEFGSVIYKSDRVSVRMKDSDKELRIHVYPVRNGKEVIACSNVLAYFYPQAGTLK